MQNQAQFPIEWEKSGSTQAAGKMSKAEKV